MAITVDEPSWEPRRAELVGLLSHGRRHDRPRRGVGHRAGGRGAGRRGRCPRHRRRCHAGRHHAESIAPAIDFVCRRAGVSLSALDAVGVDVGPGLFTGLRVGVGTAQALAFALGQAPRRRGQPRGPGPGGGDVGRGPRHARGPRGRRPAGRGLRGAPAHDDEWGVVGGVRGAPVPRGSWRRARRRLGEPFVLVGRRGASLPARSSAPCRAPSWWRSSSTSLPGGAGHRWRCRRAAAGEVHRRRPRCSPTTCATPTPGSSGRRARARADVGR